MKGESHWLIKLWPSLGAAQQISTVPKPTVSGTEKVAVCLSEESPGCGQLVEELFGTLAHLILGWRMNFPATDFPLAGPRSCVPRSPQHC
jgi:hypothetical protein